MSSIFVEAKIISLIQFGPFSPIWATDETKAAIDKNGYLPYICTHCAM